jgi:phage terminase Nu1 subunit (DNA packaging protein)
MALISRSEAARLKNVTPQAVYKAINQGRLTPVVDNDGKVMLDKDAFVEDWEKTYHPNQMKKASNYHKPRQKAVVSDIPAYEESRARTEHLKAELLEIERKQKEEQLVSSKEVKATWLQLIALAKTKVLGIPSKAKQRIPDLDVSAMNCLEDIVRESLEEIADTQAA